MPPRQQTEQVKAFFDHLAEEYAKRYTPARPFHRQLFGERLEQATAGRHFSNKTILDIGAGAGALYDCLLATHEGFDYYACDLSESMLAQSRIPEQRRFAGQVEELTFPVEKFDYIFALGLTTYLTREGLARLLAVLEGKLAAEGLAVLSFTHAGSAEWQARRRLRPLFRRLGLRRYLISQPFETNAYTPEQVQQMLPPGLEMVITAWLSPTLPLLSRLFPRAAAPLARRLALFFGKGLYSDFLVEMRRSKCFS
ncbi:MAG: class I SAM-dependent methyltransferase [Lewinellaceae bacterium]|nr:class I SAM-dependent methyltransferase [Phaeodactylibacter sp.]MCB9036116.1 class I SAM-dependent methyltransferase [Lewinellaceae bacterium]